MTAPLDAETKRRRAMTPGQLADRAGEVKATIADANEELDAIKDDLIRRGITETNGERFRATLSPPGEQQRLDKAAIEAMFTPAYIASHLLKATPTGWVLRVGARIEAAARRQAA